MSGKHSNELVSLYLIKSYYLPYFPACHTWILTILQCTLYNYLN